MQLFFMRTAKTQIRLDAQADLGLRWTHLSKGTFSDILTRMLLLRDFENFDFVYCWFVLVPIFV